MDEIRKELKKAFKDYPIKTFDGEDYYKQGPEITLEIRDLRTFASAEWVKGQILSIEVVEEENGILVALDTGYKILLPTALIKVILEEKVIKRLTK